MRAPTDTQQAPKGRRFTGRHRTLVIVGAAGVAVLAGGAAIAFAADDNASDSNSAAQAATESASSTWDDDNDGEDDYDDNGGDDDFQLPEGAISADQAAEAARAEVDGEVRDVDLEGTAESPVWEVDITDASGQEWDVVIDAFDGSVLSSVADDDSDDDHDEDDDDGDDD